MGGASGNVRQLATYARSIAKDYTATHGTAEFTAAPVPTDYAVTEDAFSLTIEALRRKLRHVA